MPRLHRHAIDALLATLLLVVALREIVAEPATIVSDSMFPTLARTERVLVEKISYGARLRVPLTGRLLGRLPGLRTPRPGDVVTFTWPSHPGEEALKRVAAVGGETVELRDGTLVVDGRPRALGAGLPDGGVGTAPRDYGPTTVPLGSVFLLGDNRAASTDSRQLGAVPLDRIEGRAWRVLWSWEGMGLHVAWGRLGRALS